MRASVIAALFLIGLLALGLRVHMERTDEIRIAEVAHAEPPPPLEAPKPPPAVEKKGNGKSFVSRTPQQTPPVWKDEVTSEFQGSPEAARRDALQKAAIHLGVYMEQRFPGFRYKPTPKFLLDNRMIEESALEPVSIENDPSAPQQHRVKVAVELRDVQLAQLFQEDRRERSVERLWLGGKVLGGILIALLALIGYVRLDDWTKGYISLALKFGALTLAVAGAVLLFWLV
jgi:hypothetical protein